MTKVYQKNLVAYNDPAVKNLDVKGPQVSHANENSDPIDIALNKYVDHPSIFKIEEYFNKSTQCKFLEVTPNNIKKSLDSWKKSASKNITPRSFSKEQDICPSLWDIWVEKIVQKGTFPKKHISF